MNELEKSNHGNRFWLKCAQISVPQSATERKVCSLMREEESFYRSVTRTSYTPVRRQWVRDIGCLNQKCNMYKANNKTVTQFTHKLRNHQQQFLAIKNHNLSKTNLLDSRQSMFVYFTCDTGCTLVRIRININEMGISLKKKEQHK